MEQIGLKGEKKVYDILKKQYPSTKWILENAKNMKINPEGRAGLGYDIEYFDKMGNVFILRLRLLKQMRLFFICRRMNLASHKSMI